jgi:branched-chain amino acid transport system substrate-binding protein
MGRGWARLVWTALLATGAAAAGCHEPLLGPPPYRGTLQVRTLMARTGPTSDNGAEYYQGISDALRETNDKGGIRGYLIEEDFYDHGYLLANAMARYAQWKADPSWPEVAMFFSWGTPDSEAFAADAALEGKPFISGSYATTLATPTPQSRQVTMPDGSSQTFMTAGAPFNFFAGTDYSTQIRIAMRFIKDRGGRKIAFAYCTKSTFCTQPIPAGKTYAKEVGLALAPDFNPELSDTEAMIEAKLQQYAVANPDVDWLWVGNSTVSTIATIKAARTHLPGAKLIANLYGFDERCGTDCAGNAYVVMSFAAFGENTRPGMAEVVRIHEKWRKADGHDPNRFKNVRYVQGFVSFLMFQKAVENLINQGKAIDGRNLKDAMEGFNNLDVGGLTAPIRFSPDDHRPTNRTRIYSVNEFGRFRFETEVKVTLQSDWLGW